MASTSSGVLGSKLGASRDSTTTGRMPLPSLPVDSAISCSAQSPKPGNAEPALASTTLSTPARLAAPSRPPSRSPGLSGSSASRTGRISSASSSSAPMSAPASPLGHQAERRERGVAAADVGVGHVDAVAGLARGLLQRRAGVGDHHDPLGRLDPGVAERLLEGAPLAVGLDGASGLARDHDDGLGAAAPRARPARSRGRRSRRRRARPRRRRRSPPAPATSRPCRTAPPGSAPARGARPRARRCR